MVCVVNSSFPRLGVWPSTCSNSGAATHRHRTGQTHRSLSLSLSLSVFVSSLFLGYYYAADRKKGKGSPYSITERRVPELIPVLGSQPAGDVSHKPGGKLPLLSARPAVTPATLKRAATNIAAW